jgi:hypothetical protein
MSDTKPPAPARPKLEKLARDATARDVADLQRRILDRAARDDAAAADRAERRRLFGEAEALGNGRILQR